MKKFKLIFHISYVIIAMMTLYLSIDILMNTETYLSKIELFAYRKYLAYTMMIFLGLSLIMIVEFILERLNVYQIKEGVEELEDENVRLKAKLYDQSEEEERDDDDEEND